MSEPTILQIVNVANNAVSNTSHTATNQQLKIIDASQNQMQESAKETRDLRLNLGCGKRKMSGYLNVDVAADCEPDLQCDLEQFPWPWQDNSVSEIILHHVLEHLGQSPKVFLAIMCELYRICKDNAKITVNVPDPHHEFFITDPTHVRAITISTLQMFDRELCLQWQKMGYANTPLAIYHNVDFKVTKAQLKANKDFVQFAKELGWTEEQIGKRAKFFNNAIENVEVELIVRKQANANNAYENNSYANIVPKVGGVFRGTRKNYQFRASYQFRANKPSTFSREKISQGAFSWQRAA